MPLPATHDYHAANELLGWADLVQISVEVALLVVLAFANVRRYVDIPVGLAAVRRQALPTQVVLQSHTTQSPRYRLGRVAVTARSDAPRVSAI